jgi:DNA-binding transcriptional LysR family regulator
MSLALEDLTTLALFAEVVDRRSFTAAASISGMAKATVSRRVSELEKRLGTRLLQRTTRSVAPTDEGRRLYDQCRRLVATAKEASDVLSDARGKPAGVLRVSCPVVFAHLHLTPLVVDYLRQNPEVELQLFPRSGPSDLVRQEIDVAIRIGQPKDESLVARRLATDTVVAVAARSYLKAHGAPQARSELAEHTVLRLSWEAEQPGWRSRGRRPNLPTPAPGSLVSSDAGVIRNAAAAGLGIAILPSFMVAAEVRSGRLIRILDAQHLATMPISAVYTARRTLPLRLRSFLDLLVDRFANEAWRKAALLVPLA